MFLLTFLVMLSMCCADPYILLIGGSKSNGEIEKFDPCTMTSKILTQHDELGTKTVKSAPVNDTHAFVTAMTDNDVVYTYYIDRNGKLSPGLKENWPHGQRYAKLASLPGTNGRRQVLGCSQKRCDILSDDGRSFKEHSNMTKLKNVFTLTTFGKELIAIGSSLSTVGGSRGIKTQAERYDGSKWKQVERPGGDHSGSAAVKLNDHQLLSCDGIGLVKQFCYVYDLGSDSWGDGGATDGLVRLKSRVNYGKLAMIGQTVYAFGGGFDDEARLAIQTLDVSKRIGNAEWQLQPVPLKVGRSDFGIWVVNGSHVCPSTPTQPPPPTQPPTPPPPTNTEKPTSGSIVTGGGKPTDNTTSGSASGGQLFGMILMTVLVFV